MIANYESRGDYASAAAMAASAGIYTYYPGSSAMNGHARMTGYGPITDMRSSTSSTASTPTAMSAYASAAPYRGKYRCGRCGQYKVNHKCLASVILVNASTQTVRICTYFFKDRLKKLYIGIWTDHQSWELATMGRRAISTINKASPHSNHRTYRCL